MLMMWYDKMLSIENEVRRVSSSFTPTQKSSVTLWPTRKNHFGGILMLQYFNRNEIIIKKKTTEMH